MLQYRNSFLRSCPAFITVRFLSIHTEGVLYFCIVIDHIGCQLTTGTVYVYRSKNIDPFRPQGLHPLCDERSLKIGVRYMFVQNAVQMGPRRVEEALLTCMDLLPNAERHGF